MKNIFKILCLVTLGATLAACTPDFRTDDQYPYSNPRTGETPVIKFSGEKEISIAKTGDTYSGSFTANLPWTVESLVDWVTITSEQRGQGGDEVIPLTFIVSRNATLKPRTGKIRVKITDDADAYIVVNQEKSLPEDLGEEWFVKPGAKGTGKSWEDAIDLGACLAACANADKIYVAAGEYQPTQYAGGSAAANKTFLVSQNVRIYGGYPANPVAGDVADPSVNKVVLGKNAGVNHVLVVAAPADDLYQVEIDGVSIEDNISPAVNAGSAKLNGAYFYNGYAGGVYISGSKGKITNSTISGISANWCGAVYLTENSDWEFDNCLFTQNSTPNQFGAAVQNGGTVTFRKCNFIQNSSNDGGGALYNYHPDKLNVYAYFYNCYISGNTIKTTTTWRPGACYLRENSHTVFVNTTIESNTANSAQVMVYATATTATECYIISSTITANTATKSGMTGGVHQAATAKVKIYNSIVSGNKSNGGYTDVSSGSDLDVFSKTNTDFMGYMVAGSAIWGNNATVSGSFDPTTMFGALKDGVYPLVGSSNPATSMGMSASELKAIKTSWPKEIDEAELAVDQKGNARTGKVMGAYVGE